MENYTNQRLELRMYSLVMYQLQAIQAGIQSGHANDEYANVFNDPEDYLNWRRFDKTVIILNAGSSTTFTAAMKELKDNSVKYCPFYEPDLYGQAFACSFLVDERVWDKTKYPDNKEYYNFVGQIQELEAEKQGLIDDEIRYREISEVQEYLTNKDGHTVKEWWHLMGSSQNVFLRDFLKKFRLFGT